MKKKYWYFVTKYVCVLCGDERVFRERQYTPKPEELNKLSKWIDEVCSDCWYYK